MARVFFNGGWMIQCGDEVYAIDQVKFDGDKYYAWTIGGYFEISKQDVLTCTGFCNVERVDEYTEAKAVSEVYRAVSTPH